MEQNPKINKWLNIGIRRFSKQGDLGININDMSEEMGVAKTSFYFFFNSRDEYLEQLFAYWVNEGTIKLINMVDRISDPAKRFLALSKMIESNMENEAFYFQLKLFAENNQFARPYLDEADKQRNQFSLQIFLDAGHSSENAERLRRRMKVFFIS